MNPNVLTFSRATYVGPSGATAAATYLFMTKDYKPPQEARYLDTDVVKNQNGKFKYVYDNGPGFREWSPFSVMCENVWQQFTGYTAAQQYNNLRSLWEHKGVLGMAAPEGTYVVHWKANLEQNFRVFPRSATNPIEREIIVQFEEGQ